MAKPSLPSEFRIMEFSSKYTSTAKHFLYSSCVDPLSLTDVINMADKECEALWTDMKLSYTDSVGNALLRHEIAQLHQVTADDVLTVVPREGIFIALHCLINHVRKEFDDERPHVILTFPSYQCLDEQVKLQQCNQEYWRIKETDSGWTFDLDDLKSIIRDDTRLLVVNFPHNPSGYIPSLTEWTGIMQICKDRNIYLFSDDMYHLSCNDGSEPLPSACTLMDNAVSLYGLSKTFALPGLRMGWLCTRNEDIMRSMKNFKSYTTNCSPGPCEVLAIIALRNKHNILRRTQSIIAKNLELLGVLFQQYSDLFEWHKPRASTVALLKLKGWLLDLGDGGATGFCDALAREAGVVLLPSGLFGMVDDRVRIGFGMGNIEDGLSVLQQFLEHNKPQ